MRPDRDFEVTLNFMIIRSLAGTPTVITHVWKIIKPLLSVLCILVFVCKIPTQTPTPSGDNFF